MNGNGGRRTGTDRKLESRSPETSSRTPGLCNGVSGSDQTRGSGESRDEFTVVDVSGETSLNKLRL